MTYVCPTSWRQRIGMTSSTRLKEKTTTIDELKQKYDELIRKNEEQDDLSFSKTATSRARTLNFSGIKE